MVREQQSTNQHIVLFDAYITFPLGLLGRTEQVLLIINNIYKWIYSSL